MEECERAAITAALASCEFHRERNAKSLGISLRTLHYKMGRYGLNRYVGQRICAGNGFLGILEGDDGFRPEVYATDWRQTPTLRNASN